MLEHKDQVVAALEEGFGARRILVVGDCMLDRYAWGAVTRISPEAPVPIVRLDHETATGGGAANVALNLANLGLSVTLAGIVGHDDAGRALRTLMENMGVSMDGVISVEDRPTVTKTRVMGGHQQMLRLDSESDEPVPPDQIARLWNIVNREIAAQPAVVLLSDYAKGALPAQLCQDVISAAAGKQIPVIVDPKGLDFSKYRGATAICPNRQELATVMNIPADDLEALLQSGQNLTADLQLRFMVVTLGDQGIALVESDRHLRIPAAARDVYDVSGAGDSVIATLAACTAAGLERMDSMHLANLAGSIVVGKVGTAPIQLNELLQTLVWGTNNGGSLKLKNLEELRKEVKTWQDAGRKIVFTNGCFDLLHPGHVAYLEAARALGDALIVGLNTDRSVTALKGPGRPVMMEADRVKVLAGLASVDRIILFDEDTPLSLIKAISPDVLAKGADYDKEKIVGAQEVEAAGGEVAIIPLMEGRSTSRLIDQLRSGSGAKGATT